MKSVLRVNPTHPCRSLTLQDEGFDIRPIFKIVDLRACGAAEQVIIDVCVCVRVVEYDDLVWIEHKNVALPHKQAGASFLNRQLCSWGVKT